MNPSESIGHRAPYGAVAAAAGAVVYAWLWYGLALARAARDGR